MTDSESEAVDTLPEQKSVRIFSSELFVSRFGATFSGEPARSLHTVKTRIVWREVEPGYFLGITVNLPASRRPGKDGTEVRFACNQ